MASTQPKSTAPSATRKRRARLQVVSGPQAHAEERAPSEPDQARSAASSIAATAPADPGTAFGDLAAYARDVTERSVLFWYTLRHLKPLTIGANCAFGADKMRPYLAELAKDTDTLIMAFPNAGLPNELGQYDELPEKTAQLIREWTDEGLVNIVGGCCGTTPAHIAAIAKAVAGAKPRALPDLDVKTRLSGLEPFTIAA